MFGSCQLTSQVQEEGRAERLRLQRPGCLITDRGPSRLDGGGAGKALRPAGLGRRVPARLLLDVTSAVLWPRFLGELGAAACVASSKEGPARLTLMYQHISAL